jgi:four helix bundle protein
MKISSYKDLIVWQKGMDLAESVYNISKNLPANEQFGLTSQIRRAAVSIPSNIAEGYGRQSTGNYRQFLSISRGSLLELETQLLLCVRLNYFNLEETEKLLENIDSLARMLSSLITKIK